MRTAQKIWLFQTTLSKMLLFINNQRIIIFELEGNYMNKALRILWLMVPLIVAGWSAVAQPSVKIGTLKYSGGGDWYANKTALPNLIAFCNQNLHTNIAEKEDIVEVGSADLFYYPYVYMTGHGNVVFSDDEAQNLRNYLMSGGFLHIDDNYG